MRILLIVVAGVVLLVISVIVIGSLLPKRHVCRAALLTGRRLNIFFP